MSPSWKEVSEWLEGLADEVAAEAETKRGMEKLRLVSRSSMYRRLAILALKEAMPKKPAAEFWTDRY